MTREATNGMLPAAQFPPAIAAPTIGGPKNMPRFWPTLTMPSAKPAQRGSGIVSGASVNVAVGTKPATKLSTRVYGTIAATLS